MTKKNFAGIDVLRFLAATFVCLFHIAFMNTMVPRSAAFVISGGTYHFDTIHALTSVGWVGVQIFFVVSGFVIFGSAKGTAGEFVKSRLLRLYPAVWICAPISLLIALAYSAYPASEAPTRIVRSALLWPKGNWVDGVYWTLGIELVFYTTVFLALVLNCRRYFIVFCIFLGCVSSTYWLLQGGAQNDLPSTLLQPILQLSSWGRYFELTLIPHGCYFAIGAALYVVLCEGGSRWLWAAIGYFSCGAMFEIHSAAQVQGTMAQFQMNSVLAASIWIVCVLFLILSVEFGNKLAKPLSKIQARTLGGITYPLYLLHTTVGAALLSLCANLNLNLWAALLMVYVSVVVIAYGVHAKCEQPFRQFLSTLMEAMLRMTSALKISARYRLGYRPELGQ